MSRSLFPMLRPTFLRGLFCLLIMVVLLPAVTPAFPADGQAQKMGPLLQRALTDPAGVMRRGDGTYAVWVFFTDRGLSPAGLAAALSEAEDQLPSRTLKRRAKMKAKGQPLIDISDLPIAPVYLREVAATGAVLRQQSRWLNAASFDADPVQLAAIAELTCVRRLELLARFRRELPRVPDAEREESARVRREALSAKAPPWRLDYGGSLPELAQINVPAVHEMGINGQGVILGMLDTGWKLTHDAFADLSVLATYDFVKGDTIVENQPEDLPEQHNHGTMTLSTIAGFKPGALIGAAWGAEVILAKTEDVSREVPIEEDWWVAGLEWVETLGADVVSSSLGYYDWYGFSDLDGNTATTTIAADLAVDRGVVVVNSAGNSRWGFGHIIAPADGHGVIAVGAVTLAGVYASFSSPGPTFDGRIKPDVAALGVDNYVVSVANDQDYALVSGTSLSCPLAAGVAALILARAPGLTPLQVREAMRETADRAQAPDNDYGWGIINALAAVTYWGATIVHTPLPDTVQTEGPYLVSAAITGRLPLDPSRMDLVWRAGAGAWQRVSLVPAGRDQWQAPLPNQPSGTTVAYFLEVTDTADVTVREPFAGAEAPHLFMIDYTAATVPPRWTALVGSVPNPFNPQTVIIFDLADSGPARLDIYDLRGRHVRSLVAADLPAGRHQGLWDGRDARGRNVAAGVYQARLEAGAVSDRLKLSLVR